jgi:hypothetical protein
VSDNELSVAFSNKDRYHLGLVTSDSINIDRGFFRRHQLEDEYNQINSGIYIKPCDFEIFVNVQKQEETQLEQVVLNEAPDVHFETV